MDVITIWEKNKYITIWLINVWILFSFLSFFYENRKRRRLPIKSIEYYKTSKTCSLFCAIFFLCICANGNAPSEFFTFFFLYILFIISCNTYIRKIISWLNTHPLQLYTYCHKTCLYRYIFLGYLLKKIIPSNNATIDLFARANTKMEHVSGSAKMGNF